MQLIKVFLPQPASLTPYIPPSHPTGREAEHSSSSRNSQQGNGVREERRYVWHVCGCGLPLSFRQCASAGRSFAVSRPRFLPSPPCPQFKPMHTLRHRPYQEDFRPDNHRRGLGFLQCDWFVLFHLFADHAGGATCSGARTTGGTWRREQQQWGQYRGRGGQWHVAASGRQHPRSTTTLSSDGAGWGVLWRGLWLGMNLRVLSVRLKDACGKAVCNVYSCVIGGEDKRHEQKRKGKE